MKDQTGRLSGYGYHGDRRERRKRTRAAAAEEDLNPVCDNCGKRNAKHAGNWRMLCLECRQQDALEDDLEDDGDYGY